MIELGADGLCVLIDPERGAAITSVRTTDPDVEILYRAHWPPGPLEHASESDVSWTKAWSGGWNALFPNAGAACLVEGHQHPFHGDASMGRWALVDAQPAAARLQWRSNDGLTIDRRITTDGTRVTATSTVRNEGAAALAHLLVEHLILGEAVLGPTTTVEVENAYLMPLADDGPPLPGGPLPWPHADRGFGLEDWSTRPPAAASRFGALHDVHSRAVAVRVPDHGLELRVRWSGAFPFLWYWEERNRYDGDPWDGRVVCLGLEPATCATGEGLAAAAERGEAPVLLPGEAIEYRVALEVTR